MVEKRRTSNQSPLIVPELQDAIPLPPTSLLEHATAAAGPDVEVETAARTLAAVFTQFQIDARVTGYARGPAAVAYDVEPGREQNLTQIMAVARNIEYALPGASVTADAPGARGVTIQVPSTRQCW